MTESEKEDLFNRWNSCNQKTRTRLAWSYLLKMEKGEGQLGWLHFLKSIFKEYIHEEEIEVHDQGTEGRPVDRVESLQQKSTGSYTRRIPTSP